MTVLGALALLLALTSGLLLLLIGLVVGRKTARDRAERRMANRRRLYAEAVRGVGGPELEAMMCKVRDDRRAQTDLMIELGRIRIELDAERRHDLASAAEASGLAAEAVKQIGHHNAVVRGHGGLLLARLGTPAAAEYLQILLHDRDADVRLVACAGLALAETRGAARSLAGALRDDRIAPERIIERLAARWALEPVLELLADETGGDEDSARFRTHLARVLGLIGDRAASSTLVELLTAGGQEERTNAARSLGSAGDETAVAPLVAALGDDAWTVRAQAARALGRLGGAGEAEPLGALLRDGAWWVRAAAAAALGEIGPAGHAVLRSALHSPDRFTRDRASEQLALLELAASNGREAPVVA